MTEKLLDQSSELLSRLKFEAWELFSLDKRSDLVVGSEESPLQVRSAVDRGLGMRGLLRGRAGHASTTRMDSGGLSECADALAASALCGSPGAILALPGPEAAPESFEACDRGIEDLSTEEMASLADGACASAASGSDAPPAERACQSDRGVVAIRNSLGLDVRFRLSRITLRLTGEARGDTWEPSAAWTFGYGPSALDPAALGREFSRVSAARRSAVPSPEGRFTVLLAPRAAAQFAGWLAAPARQEGALSGSAAFALIDDGRLPGGYGSTPFDGEGAATRRLVLVEKGLFKARPHTAATAAQAGATSTGNALRPDFAFAPALGFHNLHLAPTAADPRETLKGLSEGIYLEEIGGPLSSGRTSGAVQLEGWGFRIHRGEFAEPVRGVRIRARLDDLLLRFREVGPDLATFPGGTGGATCLLEDVPIGS
jgi:PmbA protein